MKMNEVEFKAKLEELFNGEVKLVSRFKGLSNPILVEDKYGVMSIGQANWVFHSRPSIKAALNKTEYFMNQLREKYPDIAAEITPASEYEAMKKKMLFTTKFGLVSVMPDMLIAGHRATIRCAVNRKEYMRNQLLYLYDHKYDFEILSTDRHEGNCILICPIHGRVEVDNNYIFEGCGCLECNNTSKKSDTLYLIRLYNDTESFYKVGITFKKDGKLRRYHDYKKMGYNVEPIKEITFDSYEICKEKELKLKRLIKNDLYLPENWPNDSTTECFKGDLLHIILQNL